MTSPSAGRHRRPPPSFSLFPLLPYLILLVLLPSSFLLPWFTRTKGDGWWPRSYQRSTPCQPLAATTPSSLFPSFSLPLLLRRGTASLLRLAIPHRTLPQCRWEQAAVARARRADRHAVGPEPSAEDKKGPPDGSFPYLLTVRQRQHHPHFPLSSPCEGGMPAVPSAAAAQPDHCAVRLPSSLFPSLSLSPLKGGQYGPLLS